MPNTKPFVTAALVCESILHEKDGVLSAIRIVDMFFVGEKRLSAAKGVNAALELHILLMLKSGDLIGDGTITLKVRSPSNKTVELPQSFTAHLKGGENGANVHVIFALPFKHIEFGLFWMDVFWNGEELTSIPFKLVSGEKPSLPEQAKS